MPSTDTPSTVSARLKMAAMIYRVCGLMPIGHPNPEAVRRIAETIKLKDIPYEVRPVHPVRPVRKGAA